MERRKIISFQEYKPMFLAQAISNKKAVDLILCNSYTIKIMITTLQNKEERSNVLTKITQTQLKTTGQNQASMQTTQRVRSIMETNLTMIGKEERHQLPRQQMIWYKSLKQMFKNTLTRMNKIIKSRKNAKLPKRLLMILHSDLSKNWIKVSKTFKLSKLKLMNTEVQASFILTKKNYQSSLTCA